MRMCIRVRWRGQGRVIKKQQHVNGSRWPLFVAAVYLMDCNPTPPGSQAPAAVVPSS